MEAARPLLLLLLLPLLLLLFGCHPSAAADCKASASKTSPMFTATVTWSFDPQTQTCKMQTQGSTGSSSPTTIKMDETKTIAGLSNDCLYFGCWFTGPLIDFLKSSCFVEGCCVKVSEVRNEAPSCQCFVGLTDTAWPLIPYTNVTRSFNVSTQYVCGQNQGLGDLRPSNPFSCYHAAHWPPYPLYPYHPYYPAHWSFSPWSYYHPYYPGPYPSYPGYFAGPWAPWSYPPFHYASAWPYYCGNYTDVHTQTGAGSGGTTTPAPTGAGSGGTTTPAPTGAGSGGTTTPAPTGAGSGGTTTPAPTGCSYNGTTVAEGTVTKSDLCGKTVCQGGKLVTQNTGGVNGCAYEPSKQCIKEGSNVTIHEQTTCFTVSCQKNGTEAQGKLDTQRSGCFYEGKCYPGGSQVAEVGTCKTVSCQQDATTGQFSLIYNVTGCLTFDGRCVDVNSTWVDDCSEATCEQDSKTGEFLYKVTLTACISLTEPHTCRFDHDESDGEENRTCIYNTCKTSPTNHWETHFKTTENCSAVSVKDCETDKGVPGCEYGGKCHPVKTILAWNNCTQFVCYSEDEQLNAGSKSNARPVWMPRALGCYGPPGCMKFGEDFVDTNTNNTHRCGYNISGLGHKYPQLLSPCATPSAINVAMGTVVRADLSYYACTQDGMQILQLNQTVPMPGEVADCGRNPVTNDTMYPGNRYLWSTSFCEISPDCSKTCTYFDTPCYIDDNETDAKTRALGETFTLGNAECACTRDKAVNNHKPSNGSRANTPSLCAEDGVRGGACKDPDSPGVTRQWGELWVRPKTNPSEICTCNPDTHKAFCSVQASDVVNLPITAGKT